MWFHTLIKGFRIISNTTYKVCSHWCNSNKPYRLGFRYLFNESVCSVPLHCLLVGMLVLPRANIGDRCFRASVLEGRLFSFIGCLLIKFWLT